MKEIIVNTTKEFDEEFDWINYKEFVRKALMKTRFKKDYKLYNVTLIDMLNQVKEYILQMKIIVMIFL